MPKIVFAFRFLSVGQSLKQCCSRVQLGYVINHREEGRAGRNPQQKIHKYPIVSFAKLQMEQFKDVAIVLTATENESYE